MLARESLALGLLLLTSALALPAENTTTLVGHGQTHSFRIDVPDSWKVTYTAGSNRPKVGQIQLEVFDLERASSTSNDPATSVNPVSIRGFIYTDKVPTTVRARFEGLSKAPTVELPNIDGLTAWTLVEAPSDRMLNAYIQLGSDVLNMVLGAPNDALYSKGKSELVQILKSYREEMAPPP